MPFAAWLVGTATNCLAVSALPPLRVTRCTTTPAKTATSEPDSTFVKLFAFMKSVSHSSKMPKHTDVTSAAVMEA